MGQPVQPKPSQGSWTSSFPWVPPEPSAVPGLTRIGKSQYVLSPSKSGAQPVTGSQGLVGSIVVPGSISSTESPALINHRPRSNNTRCSAAEGGPASIPRPSTGEAPMPTQVWDVSQTSPMNGSHSEPQARTRVDGGGSVES